MTAYLLSAVIMLCIAFIPGYNFWTKIRGAFYAFFGLGFVVFALCVLILGVKTALDSFKRNLAVGTAAGFMLSSVFSSLVHLFGTSIETGGTDEWIAQLESAAAAGMNISERFCATGGVMGALIGGGLLHLLGKAGAFIVIVLLLVLSVVLFFGISFSTIGEAISLGISGGKVRFDITAAAAKEKAPKEKK